MCCRLQDEGELGTRDEAKFLDVLGKLRAQKGSMMAAEQQEDSSDSHSEDEELQAAQQPSKRRRYLKDVLAEQVHAELVIRNGSCCQFRLACGQSSCAYQRS